MTNLIIAYALIAVALSGYGLSLFRRLRAVENSLRALDED